VRCHACLIVNPAGNRFCENCGTHLQLACARCGHDVGPSARFCGNCGHALGGDIAAAEAAPPQWGELKQATVLFADVVGSTELIAAMEPEEAMGRLRPAVLRMRHSVERFGGTVVRTLGDGVMALFGVPRSLEGHALLACQAALHMQDTFERSADGLAIRVGLHSGEVASDPQDAEDGRGGGAHGLTIHLASRVVGLAEPGSICLTDACREAAGPLCDTAQLGRHGLKGIRDAVVIHRLERVGSHASPRPGAEIGGSSFRGRAAEIAALQGAFDEVAQGIARVVGVVGEPGAGKSRLCHEFVQDCRAKGVPVHEVRAQLYGHALPLQPVLELFRVHFFGLGPADDAAVARERIAAQFACVPLQAGDLEILHEFFGVAERDAHVALGPRTRQARLLALMRELLRAQAHVLRVILIEDLHWLDEGSEEFLALLVAAVAGTHTFLLVNYRPAYRCPWAQLPHFHELRVGELPPGEMESLVAELLAPATDSREVRDLICRRAGGNPFFAEELARSLLESRLLDGTGLPRGGMRAVEHALPATVQAVVGARLDRVGEPEKTLLQMCAIIGKDIPLAVLQHVASPLAGQIQRGLDGLCEAGLILPQPAQGGRHFAFRHPLIQEVAYNAQLKVRRSQVHASVAAAMELFYAEQLDEFAALIAYHFEAALQYLPAARYMARAARWVAATDSARGIGAWRKVHALLDHCPRSAEVDTLRAFASGRIVYLGWREGLSLEEVQRLTEEAIRLASDADRRLVQLLLFAQGRLMQSTGGPADGYVESILRAIAMSGSDADAGRDATLQLALSHAYTWAGRLNEALQANDAALSRLADIDELDREFLGFSPEQWAYGIRVRLLNKMGRFGEAGEYLARLATHAEAGADPVMRQIAHHAYVDHAWCNNDGALARRHSERVIHFARQESSPYAKVLAHASHAMALQVGRELHPAREKYTEALQLVRASKVAVDFEAELLAGLAECQLEVGEFEAAATTAADAVGVSRERSNRVSECRALMALGCALAAEAGATPSEQALGLLSQAESLLAQTGAEVLRPAWLRAQRVCTGRESLGAPASAPVRH
jgi:adenylate cyclase